MRHGCMWACLFGLAGTAPVAAEQPLRICVSDHAYPPLTFPYRDGQAQYLIRRAAGEAGWQVEFVVLPWRRCLKAVTLGDLDGVATVADTPDNRSKLAMPLRRGRANSARSVGEVVAVAIRWRGSRVEWDGVSFRGLRTPVIHQAGTSAFSARLAELGQAGLDNANSPEKLMRMLLMGRAEVALGLEPRVSELLRQPQFAVWNGCLSSSCAAIPTWLSTRRCMPSSGHAWTKSGRPLNESVAHRNGHGWRSRSTPAMPPRSIDD